MANFTYYPEKPVVNQPVTFDASSSYDPDGKIINYEWDFGDGNVTSTTHEIIKHSYSESGSYKVTLTVTDDEGAKNSTTKIITVMPAQPSVSISTDKYEYTAGDTMFIMFINITLANPTDKWWHVKFLWRLDLPKYGLRFPIINNISLWLPPGYEKAFTLPWRLPRWGLSFDASWYVALFDAKTHELISEDHADWEYLAEKAKKTEDVEGLEKSAREIEIPF
ncbi:MAG: PKD domain-containing protein [Candidatus Methanospirareceae archaeon]